MTELVDVVLGGTFHAAVLFLVAAGLQLVFGVQKIVNLACGSFYALGAYFGITAVGLALKLGMPPLLFFPVLIVAGLAIGLVGLADRARVAHDLSPRRELSVADHVRLSPDVPGRVPLPVGRHAAHAWTMSIWLTALRMFWAFGCRPIICW